MIDWKQDEGASGVGPGLQVDAGAISCTKGQILIESEIPMGVLSVDIQRADLGGEDKPRGCVCASSCSPACSSPAGQGVGPTPLRDRKQA